MKRIILLSLMTFFALYSQAQFYSSEACFFLEAGKDPKSAGPWMVILFKGKEAFVSDRNKGFEYIQDNFKNNPKYFDNKDCWVYKYTYTYSPASSTNSEYVYKRDTPRHYVDFGYAGGYWANESYEKIVLNKEESSLVYYSSSDNRKFFKIYYTLIPRSEAIKLFAPGINNSFME